MAEPTDPITDATIDLARAGYRQFRDRLIVLGTWRATARATGARVDVPFAHVLRYRDGKVVYFRNYLDTATALQALG